MPRTDAAQGERCALTGVCSGTCPALAESPCFVPLSLFPLKYNELNRNILREHFNWCLATLAAVSALLQFHGDLKVAIRKCSTDVLMHPSTRSYFTFHHFSVPVNKLAVNIMQKHLFFLFSVLLQINMCVLDVGLASRCSNYFRSAGRRWNCVKLLWNRESRGEEMCRPLARCEWLLFQLKRMTHVTAAAPNANSIHPTLLNL